MSVRTERVASVIKTEIGSFIQRHFPLEEVGLVTVTEVRVTPDLRQAKIFVSVLGEQAAKEASLAALEAQKADMRSAVGQAVRLRFTPELNFVLDTTMDQAMKLEKIFKQIHDEERSRNQKDDPEDET